MDKNLVEKLKPEMTGMPAWAVRGCLAWQTDGLRPPPAVVDATIAYWQEQDTFHAFLDDRCEIAPNYVVRCSARHVAIESSASNRDLVSIQEMRSGGI